MSIDLSQEYEQLRRTRRATGRQPGVRPFGCRRSTSDRVGTYRNFSRVEAGFRCFKSVDLKVRPINHRLADRVRAERKASTHQTEDGLPVHSFQGLLGNLATLCKNRVKVEHPSPVSFQQYTSATPLRRRAFELLEVTNDL